MRMRLRNVSLLETLGGSAVMTFSREPHTSWPCSVLKYLRRRFQVKHVRRQKKYMQYA